jgi:hypothetical protein
MITSSPMEHALEEIKREEEVENESEEQQED